MTQSIVNPGGLTLQTVAGMLFALTAAGCGEDLTAPPPADVSGLYQGMIVTEPATCTPASAFDLLEPALGDRDFPIRLRVEDLGNQIRLTVLEITGATFVGDSAVVGSFDPDGTVRLERPEGTEQITLGGRTLIEQPAGSSTGKFERTADPITFNLDGTVTQVFRDGSASGPVFATCTQSQSITGMRTGG